MLTSHDEIFKMSFTKIILQALIYLDLQDLEPSQRTQCTRTTTTKCSINTDDTSLKLGQMQ